MDAHTLKVLNKTTLDQRRRALSFADRISDHTGIEALKELQRILDLDGKCVPRDVILWLSTLDPENP